MNDHSKFDQPDLESLLPAVPFSRPRPERLQPPNGISIGVTL